MRIGWGRPSITRQLISVLVIGFSVLWIAGAAVSTATLYGELNETRDEALRETAQRLLALAVDDLSGKGYGGEYGDRDDDDDDDDRAVPTHSTSANPYIIYQILGERGQVLLRSDDAPQMPMVTSLEEGLRESGNLRLYVEHASDGDFTVVAAENIEARREAVFDSAKALLWPLLLAIPLGALSVWLTVRSAMTPVKDLGAQITERGSANLSPLDLHNLPRELTPITDSLETLMQRLRGALLAEKAFAANSAHEMRTPIAAALAQVQRLEAENVSDPKGRIREIESTLKRLGRLVEKLTQLSRADAGIGLSENVTDVLPALDFVVSEARNAHPGRAIVCDLAESEPLFAAIDIDALGIVLRNLIENALIHGTQDRPVEIWASSGAIHVANDGAVVPADVLEYLKDRFQRGETGAEGTGLGLAIVDSILTKAGGRLALFSPRPDQQRGFEAVAYLPKG